MNYLGFKIWQLIASPSFGRITLTENFMTKVTLNSTMFFLVRVAEG
jgi:hypothetical protein